MSYKHLAPNYLPLCFNCRSLVSKLPSMSSFMYASMFDIFCLTETWLSDFIYDNEVIPTGYSLYRKDRSSRGGGVLVAVSDSIQSAIITTPSKLEVVAVSITLQEVVTFCVTYVPPSASIEYIEQLCSLVLSLSSLSGTLIVVGDFNYADIDWSTLSGSCQGSNHFCECVFECNLVRNPTHIKGNVLDLVLTSDKQALLTSPRVHPEVDSPTTSWCLSVYLGTLKEVAALLHLMRLIILGRPYIVITYLTVTSACVLRSMM